MGATQNGPAFAETRGQFFGRAATLADTQSGGESDVAAPGT